MSDAERHDRELPADEPSVFDEVDSTAEEAALQRAEADVAAGRVVPHEEVATWLRTWGTPDFAPAPRRWFK